MKKFLLVSLFILSACGGGSGGTSGSGAVMRNSVTPTAEVVRKSNLAVSSNIDNESKRTAHVTSTLGESYYTTISNGGVSVTRVSSRPQTQPNEYCTTPRTCNDVAFNNMKKWLIDNISDCANWTDSKDIRDALKLAGFNSELQDKNWEQIQTWIQDNSGNIKAQAQDIWADMGTHKDFDITETDLAVASHIGQDVKIKFTFGDNKKINGFEYVVTQAPNITAKLYAERKNTNGTEFNINTKLYKYTLSGIGILFDPDSEEDGGRSISLTSDTPLDLETVQARLKKLAKYYKDNGIFFTDFHTWPVDELGTQPENVTIADKVYKEVVDKIDALNDITDLSMKEETVSADVDFQSYGKELGLAYSDFGKILVSGGDDEIFHGGYPDKKIVLSDIQNMNKVMNFKGQAVGIVEKSLNDKQTGVMDIAGNANLVVSDVGDETLSVAFNKWYDVTVVRNKNGTNSITFDHYTGTDADYKFKYIDSDGVVQHQTSYNVDNFTQNKEVNNVSTAFDNVVKGRSQGDLVLDYFGPNDSNPTEFSGFAMYKEHTPVPKEGGTYDDSAVQFMMGFGGKKQY